MFLKVLPILTKMLFCLICPAVVSSASLNFFPFILVFSEPVVLKFIMNFKKKTCLDEEKRVIYPHNSYLFMLLPLKNKLFSLVFVLNLLLLATDLPWQQLKCNISLISSLWAYVYCLCGDIEAITNMQHSHGSVCLLWFTYHCQCHFISSVHYTIGLLHKIILQSSTDTGDGKRLYYGFVQGFCHVYKDTQLK